MTRNSKRIFLFGLPRSGSTLLCDRLTLPGKGIILHEPMILRNWGDGREKRIVTNVNDFGIPVDPVPTAQPGSIATTWYESELLPKLEQLQYWGAKEVYLNDAAALVERYRPHELLLLWRDPRDVALSFLELMNRALMSFSDRRTLKDEAWALECLRDSAKHLHGLSSSHPHTLLTYESLMTSPEYRASLLRKLGLPEFGKDPIALVEDEQNIRTAEVRSHDSDWSSGSIRRWEREPSGWRRTFADICQSAMQPFAKSVGYEGDEMMARRVCAPPTDDHARCLSDPGYEPKSGFDFVYAKRRGRKRVAQSLSAEDRVLDLGGTTATLAFITDAKVTVIDDGAAGKVLISKQWRQGVVPNLDAFNVCTFISSLEYVVDPLRMAQALLERGIRVVISYHCTDDIDSERRSLLGFRSDVSRADWLRFANDRNWTMHTDWAFDGFQSLIELRPPAPSTNE